MTAVNSPFLNPRQVADLLGVNYSTAWSLVKTRHLRAFPIGRSWNVPPASINAVVRAASILSYFQAQHWKRLLASKNERAIEMSATFGALQSTESYGSDVLALWRAANRKSSIARRFRAREGAQGGVKCP